MTWWLRALVALAEARVLFPAPSWWLTTIFNSSPRGLTHLGSNTMHTHGQTYIMQARLSKKLPPIYSITHIPVELVGPQKELSISGPARHICNLGSKPVFTKQGARTRFGAHGLLKIIAPFVDLDFSKTYFNKGS